MISHEITIKSDRLKRMPTGWDKYALVQWICQSCAGIVMVHEVRGECFEPTTCPLCRGSKLSWNRVYAADVNGNVTE